MGFSLVLFSPEKDVKNEISHVVTMMELGLRIFHLRKPYYSRKECANYLNAIPKKFHKRIVIHQHYSLCNQFFLKGIHLKENNKRYYSNYKLKYNIISSSFHSLEAIEKNKQPYQYVFLSPVFDSISKSQYMGNLRLLEEMKTYKKKTPVFALGGITSSNLLTVYDRYFSGIAVLGFVWSALQPVEAFKEIMNKGLV